jgi:hypothetical protein
MWVSISDITVFIRSLFSGSRGAFPGVVAFPDAILAALEPTMHSPPARRNTFKLRTNPVLPAEFPPDLSFTFTAHRESVLAFGSGRDSNMSHTVRPAKRKQIALNYASNPISPYIFQHLEFPPAEDPAAGPQDFAELILTLSIQDGQNPPPPVHVATPNPPAPALDDVYIAQLKWQIINQFCAAPNLHNATDSEDWSLADPHTLLHLVTNPSEDQSTILQLLAPKLDLATATDIWDAWAAAFAHPDGTPLTVEFRDIAVATLTSPLVTPEALSAQTSALAQWALFSCPNELLQTNTEISEEDLVNLGEDDVMNWLDNPYYSHSALLLYALILLTLLLTASRLALTSLLNRHTTHVHLTQSKVFECTPPPYPLK